jgi:hypothetical protein
VNDAQQVQKNALWIAVVNIDLQLYKASIYKLRWGTPGGIDVALPCYDEALTILGETTWPDGRLGADATALAGRIRKFKETLIARDVTTASADLTRLMYAFEDLRAGVRYWPDEPPAGALAMRTVVDLPTDRLSRM